MNEIIKDVGQLNKRVIVGGVYVQIYIDILCKSMVKDNIVCKGVL